MEITSVSVKLKQLFEKYEHEVKAELTEYFLQNWKMFIGKNIMKCIERAKQ